MRRNIKILGKMGIFLGGVALLIYLVLFFPMYLFLSSTPPKDVELQGRCAGDKINLWEGRYGLQVFKKNQSGTYYIPSQDIKIFILKAGAITELNEPYEIYAGYPREHIKLVFIYKHPLNPEDRIVYSLSIKP